MKDEEKPLTIEEFDARLGAGAARLRLERNALEAKVRRMEALAQREEEIADELERLLNSVQAVY